VASLKGLLRDLAGDALALGGITAPSHRAKGKLVLATFHRVLPEPERAGYHLPGLCVTPRELDGYLEYFTTHFDVGTLRDQWRRFRGGERTERPLLALTFDDGERDNYVHARPILARWGLKASFYIPVGHLDSQEPIWHDRLGFALLRAVEEGKTKEASAILDGQLAAHTVQERIEATKSLSPKERARLVERLEALAGAGVPEWAALMSWDEVRELHAEGHEIGCHSRHHPLLPQCEDAELEDETAGSKGDLEERIDAEVTTFCYPNGDCDARVAEATERAGYECAVTTRWGMNARTAPAFELHRCDINPFHTRRSSGAQSTARLQWRISGLHPGL